MDCCYLKHNESITTENAFSNVSSPEMFESDTEEELYNKDIALESTSVSNIANPHKPTQAELIAKSDFYLLTRINKFLSGVPPPPKHTICQSDCNEFLLHIQQNRQYFWTKCPLPEEQHMPSESNVKSTDASQFFQCAKSTARNLSHDFDMCNLQTDTTNKALYLVDNNDHKDNLSTKLELSSSTKDATNIPQDATNTPQDTDSVPDTYKNRSTVKEDSSNTFEETSPLLYNTVTEAEAAMLTWPDAYSHKFHGIHYNRNKALEEFEALTIKMCERYIGAETQSTCNVWFSKQAPGSARKRSLLAKRDNNQSPGKRLSHLARRRRTFSSANLQGLSLVDKKQLVLNVKKSYSRKGKSPRGKSPRGKSPRSSAKKKVARRLALEGPSPHKSKLETSKRALFQSPPSDRAGPSKLVTSSNNNPQKIKRALFPTPKKMEIESTGGLSKIISEETRKRKSEDVLEGPRFKWAKSLSFDCPHELENRSISAWDHERHSSGNIPLKSRPSLSQGRNELSDTHRKKLLWAVAEALRSKGIGMGHPRFKQYASNLARTVKKYMPDLENRDIPRKPGSTSDRMLKLAKHHVLFIIDARPAN